MIAWWELLLMIQAMWIINEGGKASLNVSLTLDTDRDRWRGQGRGQRRGWTEQKCWVNPTPRLMSQSFRHSLMYILWSNLKKMFSAIEQKVYLHFKESRKKLNWQWWTESQCFSFLDIMGCHSGDCIFIWFDTKSML